MAVSPADRAAAERQLGRPPRALQRVAARCPHGGPAVLEQAPYDDDGTPFPTTYWLSCRVLADAVGQLESAGGIADLERELLSDPELRADHERAEARVRANRARLAAGRRGRDGGAALLAGIAGGAPGAGLKCLHAQAAVALAAGPYALGERVLVRADVSFPAECCAWA